VRALWQSFLDPDEHGPYFGALRGHLDSFGVDFDVVGMRPPDRHLHALTEVRGGVAALRNALWAEREGYDAVVIGHFQEPLLAEIQASVMLPVVGLGEAAFAGTDGLLGLVTIDEVFVPWHEDQIRGYGAEHRVAGIRALGIGPGGFMAAMDDEDARSKLAAQLVECARPLVAAGAAAILPAGALTPAALAGTQLDVDGAPVLDCVAIAAEATRAARPSEAFRERPAAAMEEFLAATGGPLVEPLR
jgi:Asp/Glu/hydantoin racemase